LTAKRALPGIAEGGVAAIAVDRGFINYPSLAEHDPFFEKVRGEPRFQKLLKTVRERWEKFEP
jgi:hypothetical protein